MIIKENDNLRNEIFAFLDETDSYTDYNQKIEDVMEEFSLSEQEAENFVWNWASNSDSSLIDEFYLPTKEKEDESVKLRIREEYV